jgi:hypothetical protein
MAAGVGREGFLISRRIVDWHSKYGVLIRERDKHALRAAKNQDQVVEL